MATANDNVAIAAAFFAGFNRMMAPNLCWNGSFVTLLRFGISPSKIGCFIGDTSACMYFWSSWGILLSFGLTFCGWADNTKGLSFIAPGFCTPIYLLAFAYTCYVKRFSGDDAVRLFPLVLVPIIGLFVIGIVDQKRNKGYNGKAVCPVVSCIASFFTLFTYCMLAFVCFTSHGNEGVRKLFFWLCASALAYQFDSSIATKVDGPQAAYYFLALDTYGPLLPILFGIVTLFGKCFGAKDIEYWKLFSQLLIMVVCTCVSLVVWIWHVAANISTFYMKEADTSQNAGDSFKRCWSPFIMGAIGLGSVFWLFPAVWPFMVCHCAHFRFVMLFQPVLGFLGFVGPWFLNDGNIFISHITAEKENPDNWLNELKGHFSNWNGENLEAKEWSSGSWVNIPNAAPTGTDTNGNWLAVNNVKQNAMFFHATWFLLLFIFILCWIITCCIHYPRGFVARCVLHTRWAVLFGALSFFISQLFKAFGLTGVFANAIGARWNNTANQKGVSGLDYAHGGTFGTVSFNFSLFHLTASLFTNQAYSVGIGSFKNAVDSGCAWPTQGLGGFRSFFWWLGYGLKNGNRRFRSLAHVDIISVIS